MSADKSQAGNARAAARDGASVCARDGVSKEKSDLNAGLFSQPFLTLVLLTTQTLARSVSICWSFGCCVPPLNTSYWLKCTRCILLTGSLQRLPVLVSREGADSRTAAASMSSEICALQVPVPSKRSIVPF